MGKVAEINNKTTGLATGEGKETSYLSLPEARVHNECKTVSQVQWEDRTPSKALLNELGVNQFFNNLNSYGRN